MKLRFDSILSLPSKTQLDSSDRFRLRLDETSSYFVAPEGVWRGPAILAPDVRLVPLKLPAGAIENFYLADDAWFLLKEHGNDGRVFLRSDDEGKSWQPWDDGLEVEWGGRKSRMVPTRMAWQNGVVFLNAGGGRNFMSSRDGGKHWALLAGSWGMQPASAGEFLVGGADVLLGGEAPLDFAYLNKGELAGDAATWKKEPEFVAPEGIENRNVQFIEAHPDGKALLAGVEGGLLESDDGGSSWRFSQRFESGEGSYPYFQHISFSASRPDWIWAGGFDKATDGLPYLSVSADRGKTWMDVSKALRANPDWRDLLSIHESADGSTWVSVFDSKRMRVEVGVLAEI